MENFSSLNNKLLKEKETIRELIFKFTFLFGFLMQLSFAVYNSLNGIVLESILDFSSSVLFLVSIILCFKKIRLLSIIIAIGTIIYVSVYSFFCATFSIEGTSLGFYLIPIPVFYFLDVKKGIIWNIVFFFIIAIVIIVPWSFLDSSFDSNYILRFLATFFMLSFFAGFQKSLREKSLGLLLDINKEVVESTEQITLLEGFVPICMYCKKIKNKKGYWNQLENYLKSNTNAQISSSLCDSCLKDVGLDSNEIYADDEKLTKFSDTKNILKKSKKKFIFWGGIIGSIVISIFAYFDFLGGEFLEAILDLTASSVMLITVLLLRKDKIYTAANIITFGSLQFLLIQPFIWGNPNIHEILWFFLIPLIANYLFGYKKSLFILIPFFLFVLLLFQEPSFLPKISLAFDFKFFFLLIFSIITVLSFFIERSISKYITALEDKIFQLQENYSNIKAIKGLVPVCSACHSIKNEEGFWTKLETYINNNSDLKLSHGICDDCLKSHFPDSYKTIIEKREAKELFL